MDEALKQELVRFTSATANALAELCVAVGQLKVRVAALEVINEQERTTKDEF